MVDLWHKLGGASYHVSSKTDPKIALAEAMEKTGVDWRVLAQNGWAGPLHQLIHSYQVRDVIVQHPGQIWVRNREGQKSQEPVHVTEQWIRFLAKLWSGGGDHSDKVDMARVKLDPHSVTRKTLLFPNDGGGIRWVYSPQTFSSWGSSLYIRRLPSKPAALSEMVRNGTLPQGAADLLVSFLKTGTPIIVSGQTGSGKTTLLAALIAELQTIIDPVNLLIVERTHEIPTVKRAFRWEQDAESRVSLDHLAEKATQMGLEWLVLGECTGSEAFFVAKAFGQGIPVMTTLHASSATAALKKLSMLALEHIKDPRMLPAIMGELAEQGIVSVHLSLKERPQFGLLGAVTGIVEMTDVAGDDPVVNPYWEWQESSGQPGNLVWNPGALQSISPAMLHRYLAAGEIMPVPKSDEGKSRHKLFGR